MELAWSSPKPDFTTSVAWGDWDGDGDLDLAVGNYYDPNQVYENVGGRLRLAWTAPGRIEYTRSVAWGDWNNDGRLDLAVGNEGFNVGQGIPNRVYANTGSSLELAWTSPVGDFSSSVAWGDWDGDGDLDLAVGNEQGGSAVNENIGGNLQLAWTGGYDAIYAVAWGDWDVDGDSDLVFGALYGSTKVYANLTARRSVLPDNCATALISYPGGAVASFFSSAKILSGPIVPIDYRIFDTEFDIVRIVRSLFLA